MLCLDWQFRGWDLSRKALCCRRKGNIGQLSTLSLDLYYLSLCSTFNHLCTPAHSPTTFARRLQNFLQAASSWFIFSMMLGLTIWRDPKQNAKPLVARVFGAFHKRKASQVRQAAESSWRRSRLPGRRLVYGGRWMRFSQALVPFRGKPTGG